MIEIKNLLIIAVVFLVAATLFFFVQSIFIKSRARKELNEIDEMVERALRGEFDGTAYDESLLSAVELRLVEYLRSSRVSEANLLEEKSKITELVSDISHQTKTPIANILLYSQLLAEQSLSGESREYVELLNAQAAKLHFLIQALVKTSRLETGILQLEPRESSTAVLIQSVLKQAKERAGSRQITLTEEAKAYRAVFDAKWTAEALFNIVDNAVKYTPAGGHVRLSSREYELFVCIQVTDDGMGISEEEIPRIFERFYRGPKVSNIEGTGLGLYLAREIISREGGYLKVSSKIGSGSTFSIFLSKL